MPQSVTPGKFILIWEAAKRCAASLLVLLGGFAALVTAQGQESLITVIDSPNRLWVRVPGFALATLFWAASIWYWAAWNLSFRRNAPTSFELPAPYRAGMSLAAGYAAFVLAVAALVVAFFAQGDSAPKSVTWGFALLIAAVIVAAALFAWAMGWVNRRLRAGGGEAPIGLANLLAAPQDRRQSLRQMTRAEHSMLLLSLGALMFGVAISAYDADAVGAISHPVFIVLWGLSLWLPLLALLSFWTRRLTFPFVTPAVLLLLIAASFVNDNHELRPPPAGDTADTMWIDRRPTPKRHMFDWRQRTGSQSSVAPATAVFVATAGGGLRAAVWTVEVLGRLDDAVPEFADRTIAISGVSGGSLGASVYMSAVAQRRAGAFDCDDRSGKTVTSIRLCAIAALRDDYLSPVAASLFFSDAFQWIIPWPLGLQDRAGAIERAWERTWTERFPKTATPFGMSGSFHRLWPREPWPALLLNGTVVESGNRVVVSNLKLETFDDTTAVRSFVDAFDFFHVYRKNVRVSTAANLSGRFPYVAPAATIRIDCAPGEGERDPARCPPGRSGRSVWGHVVDGGYFENFGAVTLADVLRDIYEDRTAIYLANVVPVVIQISSDPDLTLAENGAPRRERSHYYLEELLSPLRTFLRTRSARGVQAVGELRRLVIEELDGVFFHFHLCKLPGVPDPPLGWSISGRSFSSIVERTMSECPHNANEFDRLVRCLKHGQSGDRRKLRENCAP